MNYPGLLKALTVSEMSDGLMDFNVTDQQLREKHQGLQELYNEYIEAKHKYEMLLKLVKVTDKF